MIFATVGTQKFDFSRLIKKIDELAEAGIMKDVFAQIGHCEYIPQHFPYSRFLGSAEYDSYVQQCDLVIAHGGTGAIMNALKFGKPVLAVPRQRQYKEHVDDHQMESVKALASLGLIDYCICLDELSDHIEKAKALRPSTNNNEKLENDILSYIHSELGTELPEQSFQLLVSAVNADVNQLRQNMHLNSDAIIVNQCDTFSYEELMSEGHQIRAYHLPERGVGLSRNTALNRASADIIAFSDEDMQYCDGYEDMIMLEFRRHPEADAIVFQIKYINGMRDFPNCTRFQRVGPLVWRKFATYQIAVRREKLLKNNIHFSSLFGGGARYLCGEDTIFINDMRKSGMKLYMSPAVIGQTDLSESCWYKGNDEAFYVSKGSLLCAIYGRWATVLALPLAIKQKLEKGKTQLSFKTVLKSYLKGIKAFRS